jgi:tetratricopeptide (TPR) repeat protein
LKLKLNRTEEDKLADRPFDNVAAYDVYLRARKEVMGFSEESLNKALEHLEKGKEIVGEHPLLDAGISYVHWQSVNAGVRPPEYLDKADEYARKVVAAAPESPHGHRLLGLVELVRGSPVECMKHLTLAIAIQPNDPDALTWLIPTYGLYGMDRDAIPLSERLMNIDPLTPLTFGMSAFPHLLGGDFEVAVDLNKKMYEMEPDNPLYSWLYAQSLAYAKDPDGAVDVIDRLIEAAPDHSYTGMCRVFRFALLGEVENALAAITDDVATFAQGDLQNSWFMADCLAIIGDQDEALTWLETAINLGFMNSSFLLSVNPYFEAFRDHERFAHLISQIDERRSRLVAAV